jgi:hypothetical protein
MNTKGLCPTCRSEKKRVVCCGYTFKLGTLPTGHSGKKSDETHDKWKRARFLKIQAARKPYIHEDRHLVCTSVFDCILGQVFYIEALNIVPIYKNIVLYIY